MTSLLRRVELKLPGGNDEIEKLTVSLPKSYNIPRHLEATGLSAYEPDTLATCLAALERSAEPCLYDIGANVGVFAWLAARCVDAQVHAFEPVPWLLEGLTSVAADNELSIVAKPLAMSASEGTATFYISAKSDCSNSLREGFRRASEELSVKLDTVDAYVSRTGATPTVLKIDTESTEPDVLRGAAETIATHRPWIICEVLAGRSEAQLMDVMSGLGYVWHQITDAERFVARAEIVGDRSYRFANWLFTPEAPGEAFWGRLAVWRRRLSECGPRPALQRIHDAALEFHRGGTALSPSWSFTRKPDGAKASGGNLDVAFALPEGERFFLHSGAPESRFDAPPSSPGAISLARAGRYELHVEVGRTGRMPMQLWVQRFDGDAPAGEERLRLSEGRNVLRFETERDGEVIRLVLRLSGAGKVSIGAPLLFHEVASR